MLSIVGRIAKNMNRRSFIGMFGGLVGSLFWMGKVQLKVWHRAEVRVGVIPDRRMYGVVIFKRSPIATLMESRKEVH